MLSDNIAAQAAASSGLLGSSPGAIHPMQGMTQLEMQEMQVRRVQNAAQQSTLMAHANAYNGALLTAGSAGIGNTYRPAPRIHLEVDKVTNGYTIKCNTDIMIAKDLEELRDLFISQVVSRLLEDK